MSEDRPAWMPDSVRVLERTNGTAAPATARPNPLRRERWVPLGDLYPGHELLMRFNPNKRGVEPLPDDAKEEDRIRYGLQRMVLAHRIHFEGQPDSPWIDPDTDQPMPSPSTNEFWELISNDLLTLIMAQIVADQKKVSASVEQSSGLSIAALRATASTSPSGTPADS